MGLSLNAGVALLVLSLIAPTKPSDVGADERPRQDEPVSFLTWASAFAGASVVTVVPGSGDVVVLGVGEHRDLPTAARALATALSRDTGRSAHQVEPAVGVPAGADLAALSDGGPLVAIQVFDGRPGQTRAVLSFFDAHGALLDTVSVVADESGEGTTTAPPPSVEAAPPGLSVPSSAEVQRAAKEELHVLARVPDSDAKLTLYQVTMRFSGGGYHPKGSVSISGEGFEQICRLPCDESVDTSRGGDFFVDGHKVPRSRSFTLPDRGQVTLKVEPGNTPKLLTGAGFLAVGPVLAITGAVVLGLTVGESGSKNHVIAGGVMLPVGLLLSGLGGLLFARNRTNVSVR